jgi:transposase-like protein
MGGESTEAWRTVLDDLVRRGLRRPELLIVDGGGGAGLFRAYRRWLQLPRSH